MKIQNGISLLLCVKCILFSIVTIKMKLLAAHLSGNHKTPRSSTRNYEVHQSLLLRLPFTKTKKESIIRRSNEFAKSRNNGPYTVDVSLVPRFSHGMYLYSCLYSELYGACITLSGAITGKSYLVALMKWNLKPAPS